MKTNWNRVLPINELLSDRWEKANYVGAGEGTSIYDSCVVIGDVKIGENTWIGPFTLLDGSGGGLAIGNHCCISAGVQIYTHDTVMRTLSGGIKPIATKSAMIGDNCYIAPLSIISMGVSLGNHCVVAANSFVNKSFPNNCVIAGTPAKKIGEVIFEGGEIFIRYDKDQNK